MIVDTSTIVSAAGIPIMLWVGKTVIDVKVDVAKLREQLRMHLKEHVDG